MSSLIIHGHFYQPPRENPWTGALDHEESARPYHDWNERIHAECYRANGFARIVDGRNRIERIVNNYASLSFNFGATLLGWIERHHPQTYRQILAADRASVARLGHGNAIAQAYSHPILPLCNARDRRTQVRWGMADFRQRFGRAPEALWLPETACNDDTIGTLIDAGLRYVILSPEQAERVRPLGGGQWLSVADGSIDPRLAYRYFHRDGSGRSIAIFFYDAPVARAIAFEGALASSEGLIDRLSRALGESGPLVNVATDGESYGHHFHFGDRCLAYALEEEAPRRGLQVTNYGAFLERNPPRHEVEIKPGPNNEGTSWSCSHGVGRWCRDCGCQAGGQAGWNQAWRTPLRAAFDYLRDQAARHFEAATGDLLCDPWAARDAYIEVSVERSASREHFLARHAGRRLSAGEQSRALTLLEMQRAAMLMYTSCGWFFADLSGIESVQVMKYAARLLDFFSELGLEVPERGFLERLAEATSNLASMGNGADVYRRLVEPCRAGPRRVAAHLATTGLALQHPADGELGDYLFRHRNYRKEQHGRLTMATSRLLLTERASARHYDFALAAIHLGGLDFYGALRPFPGTNVLRKSADRLWAAFRTASLPVMLRLIREEFGPGEYALDDVLPDGRQVISQMAFGSLLEDFAAQFALLYEDSRRIVEMLEQGGFELPAEVREVAEFTLNKRFEQEIRRQQGRPDPAAYAKALEIVSEASRRGYRIDSAPAAAAFEPMVTEAVNAALPPRTSGSLRSAVKLIALARKLGVESDFEQAQEAAHAAMLAAGGQAQRMAGLARVLGLAPGLARRAPAGRRRAAAQHVDAAPHGPSDRMRP